MSLAELKVTTEEEPQFQKIFTEDFLKELDEDDDQKYEEKKALKNNILTEIQKLRILKLQSAQEPQSLASDINMQKELLKAKKPIKEPKVEINSLKIISK